jgi:hypothetical protein
VSKARHEVPLDKSLVAFVIFVTFVIQANENRGSHEDDLTPTIWVHVFEEDTAEGAVYRPDDANIPLSRRPREQLVLDADGRATFYTTGPDDRLVARPAAKTGADIQIISRSPDRLVVRID